MCQVEAVLHCYVHAMLAVAVVFRSSKLGSLNDVAYHTQDPIS